jgi:hypothetical protein
MHGSLFPFCNRVRAFLSAAFELQRAGIESRRAEYGLPLSESDRLSGEKSSTTQGVFSEVLAGSVDILGFELLFSREFRTKRKECLKR